MQRATWSRWLPLIMCAVLLAASCGSDDVVTEDDQDTGDVEEEEAAEGHELGEFEVAGPQLELGERQRVKWDDLDVGSRQVSSDVHGCVYRWGIVLGIPGLLPADTPVLEFADFTLLPGYESISEPEFEAMSSRLAFIEVDPTVDPLAVVGAMIDAGYPASPVQLVTPTVHWGYAPGTLAEVVAEPSAEVSAAIDESLAASPPGDELRHVVVLDTGLPAGSGLDQSTPVRPLNEDVDLESVPGTSDRVLPDGLRGHGLFVSSVIRQQRPDTVVTNVKVEEVPQEAFVREWANGDLWPGEWPTGPNGEPIDGALTDEVALANAVVRIQQRDLDLPPDVLNISMGTYQCSNIVPLGVVAAMDFAAELKGADEESVAVVAAAGNHDSLSEDEANEDGESAHAAPRFLPADLREIDLSMIVNGEGNEVFIMPEIVPVAALNAAGDDLATFSNWRPGHCVAIGERLLGPNGDGIVVWSGTSFATAVVSAEVAHGGATNVLVFGQGSARQFEIGNVRRQR